MLEEKSSSRRTLKLGGDPGGGPLQAKPTHGAVQGLVTWTWKVM
jgi:hypothetical protein